MWLCRENSSSMCEMCKVRASVRWLLPTPFVHTFPLVRTHSGRYFAYPRTQKYANHDCYTCKCPREHTWPTFIHQSASGLVAILHAAFIYEEIKIFLLFYKQFIFSPRLCLLPWNVFTTLESGLTCVPLTWYYSLIFSTIGLTTLQRFQKMYLHCLTTANLLLTAQFS